MITISKKIKIVLIICTVLMVIVASSTLFVPMMMDAEKMRVRVQHDLSEQLGYDVSIRSAEASFPLKPRMTFSGVIVKNHPKALSDKLMTIQMVSIDFGIFDAFTGDFRAESMQIDGLALEIQEVATDVYTLELSRHVKKILSNPYIPSDVDIQASKLSFLPLGAQNLYELHGVSGSFHAEEDGEFTSDFDMVISEHKMHLHTAGRSVRDAMDALKVELTSGEDSVRYEGKWGYIKNALHLDGMIESNIKNLASWAYLVDIQAHNDRLHDIWGENNTMKGGLAIKMQGPKLVVASRDMTMNEHPLSVGMSLVNRDSALFKINLELAEVTIDDDFGASYTKEQFNHLVAYMLPAKSRGTVDVRIKKLSWLGVESRNIDLSAMLRDGELTINQAVAHMAGDTQLLLFGILKMDINKNVNLDATLELLGKNIQAFMSGLNLDEHKLMANHEGNFRAKSTLYISPQTSTISELRFQAGDFFVEGAVDYYPEGETNYVANLKISGSKLDSLARYINPAASGALLEDNFDTPKITLPWLDSMRNSYKCTLVFDRFTLYDLEGKPSRFLLTIAPDKMQFNSVDLNVGEIKLSGDIGIDQSEAIPNINAHVYLSHFNVNSLVGRSFRTYPVKRDNNVSIWGDKPLVMDFLKGYSGVFDLEFGELFHDSVVMKNVRIKAKTDEGVWDVSDWYADVWEGSMNYKGTIDVSSIAGIKGDLRLKNVLVHRMLESTLNLSSIRGRMNINLRFDTGGITLNNLIDNLSANMVLFGRDIVIRGFDVASLVQSLPSVRSNSEIANTVRIALIKGQTTFQTVEGAFNIDSTRMHTNGLKFRSKHAIGTMVGAANIKKWAMNYALTFKLPSMAISDFPEVTLYFKKSMDDPLLSADTRALESFMTQRRFNR
ncbi:MAG: AsmA family protein [Alphaproteobacteria bacterium]|nr:MAG: AsmA family protein [Alphaproteobacteria bacterium]TAF14664.1 MAG: AsmA family protein [Alphaproteobacteria bacterium]TAF41248.1 MAG: AsmA family protein [Alphaproteobacteria bacterium]TAF75760.1 MAG: AsmA family protein [Alphaproteobacteria bacterium]